MVVPVRFGTDGIRGRAFDEISIDLAYRLGRAVSSVFDVPVFVDTTPARVHPPSPRRCSRGSLTAVRARSILVISRLRASRSLLNNEVVLVWSSRRHTISISTMG